MVAWPRELLLKWCVMSKTAFLGWLNQKVMSKTAPGVSVFCVRCTAIIIEQCVSCIGRRIGAGAVKVWCGRRSAGRLAHAGGLAEGWQEGTLLWYDVNKYTVVILMTMQYIYIKSFAVWGLRHCSLLNVTQHLHVDELWRINYCSLLPLLPVYPVLPQSIWLSSLLLEP